MASFAVVAGGVAAGVAVGAIATTGGAIGTAAGAALGVAATTVVVLWAGHRVVKGFISCIPGKSERQYAALVFPVILGGLLFGR